MKAHYSFRIVGSMLGVLGKWNRIYNLAGLLVDRDFDAHIVQCVKESVMEHRDAHRLQSELAPIAAVTADLELVVSKIERDVEAPLLRWHWARSEPAGRHEERHMPRVVGPRSRSQLDLSHDLGPHVD